MSAEAWVTIGTTVLGFLVTIATTQFSQAKTRGEFRSLLRNFPLHRHVKVKINGEFRETILYPAEYQPPASPAGTDSANNSTT